MRHTLAAVVFALVALPVPGHGQGAAERRFQIPLESSPSVGPADAPVTIFEFLDFQ